VQRAAFQQQRAERWSPYLRLARWAGSRWLLSSGRLAGWGQSCPASPSENALRSLTWPCRDGRRGGRQHAVQWLIRIDFYYRELVIIRWTEMDRWTDRRTDRRTGRQMGSIVE
jgi:hypothetical protein